jgi:hypothetical protein
MILGLFFLVHTASLLLVYPDVFMADAIRLERRDTGSITAMWLILSLCIVPSSVSAYQTGK